MLSIEQLSQIADWGTFGKDGKSPYQRVLLHKCETDHLKLQII